MADEILWWFSLVQSHKLVKLPSNFFHKLTVMSRCTFYRHPLFPANAFCVQTKAISLFNVCALLLIIIIIIIINMLMPAYQ
jgi:hypothetical protein